MRNNLQVVISSKIVNRSSSTHCGVLKFRVKYHLITLSYQLGLFLMQVTATQVKQTYQKKKKRGEEFIGSCNLEVQGCSGFRRSWIGFKSCHQFPLPPDSASLCDAGFTLSK